MVSNPNGNDIEWSKSSPFCNFIHQLINILLVRMKIIQNGMLKSSLATTGTMRDHQASYPWMHSEGKIENWKKKLIIFRLWRMGSIHIIPTIFDNNTRSSFFPLFCCCFCFLNCHYDLIDRIDKLVLWNFHVHSREHGKWLKN